MEKSLYPADRKCYDCGGLKSMILEGEQYHCILCGEICQASDYERVSRSIRRSMQRLAKKEEEARRREDAEAYQIYGKVDWDEKPEVCQTCGGPWPDCMDSCKLFDD